MQPIHLVKYIFVKSITNSILSVLTFYTRHVTYFRNVCNKHLLLLLLYVIGCESVLNTNYARMNNGGDQGTTILLNNL